MSPKHWLVKSEPSKYSFPQLVRDGKTVWDGVRNYEARNHLRSMKTGDLVLFYHSSEDKSVVGLAAVSAEAYPDPTAPAEDWSVVEISPVLPMKVPVTLDQIREEPDLFDIPLLKRSRLSVVPLTEMHFLRILELAKTKVASKVLKGK